MIAPMVDCKRLLLCQLLSSCLLTNLQRSLLQILTTEEREVSVVGKAIHLDNTLQRHVGLRKQALNLDNTLFLHPAIRRIVELLLKHIVALCNYP